MRYPAQLCRDSGGDGRQGTGLSDGVFDVRFSMGNEVLTLRGVGVGCDDTVYAWVSLRSKVVIL